MKTQLRRLIAPWMIAIVPLTGCASLQQRGGNMVPQWVQNSNQFEAKLAYARLCERHGQTKQALDIYQTLAGTRHAPTKQAALHRLAVMAAKRGDYESAELNFAQAARVTTPTAELLNDMGYNYYLKHSLAEAEQCFRQSLDKDPQYVAARNNLGLALGQQGKFDEALREFAKTGNDSQAHTNMAYVYAQHRYLDQARQHYLKALGHDEKNESAVEGLLQVARASEQTKAAVAAKASESPAVKAVANVAPEPTKTPEIKPAESQSAEKLATVDAKPTLPSTRRFETGNVSPWANQAANSVQADTNAKPQPVVLAPSIPPVVALSQPKASVAATVPAVTPNATPAPIAPSLSLPKPTPQPEPAIAKTQPSKPFGTLWGALTRADKSSTPANVANEAKSTANATAAVKPELPQVTLGQPSSLQANAANTAKSVIPTMPVTKPVTPVGSLWAEFSQQAQVPAAAKPIEPMAKSQPLVQLESTLPKVTTMAPAISVTAPLLPANPVQTAAPQQQASPSAVVTAAHAEPAAANMSAKVQQASPNNLPEVPVRLPVVTPTLPASGTKASPSGPTTISNPQASFPSTSAANASPVASKPMAISNPLVSGLAPSLPKPVAPPTKIVNPTMAGRDDTAARANRASFIDTTEPTLAPPKGSPSQSSTPVKVASSPNSTAPAPATPVQIPASITPPSVAPAGITPVTPKLPSTPQPVAPPALKVQTNQPTASSVPPQNTTVRQTADRFSTMRAAKDKPQAAAQPLVAPLRSTTPIAGTSAPSAPSVLPPNQSLPNVSAPNLAVKPIQLEITGNPSGGQTSSATNTTHSAPKNAVPRRDAKYKTPDYKVPQSSVPYVSDEYRAGGLGLDGKASNRN